MSRNLTTYDKIETLLFKSKEDVSDILTENELKVKERWMFCVNKQLDDPLIPDSELVNLLTTGCEGICDPVSKSTAYRDIAAVTRLVGNIKPAAKNWYRYMIVEGAKKAFSIAEKNNDAKGMAAALDKLGKYTRSDKNDDEYDWTKMIPPIWEPSDDVTLLGEDFEPILNLEEKRKELREFFKRNKAVDAEYIEIRNADTT